MMPLPTGNTHPGEEKPGAVLVIGSDNHCFLTTVRSFGERGYAVDVCPFDLSSAALRSAYIRNTFRLPVYHIDPDGWVEALLKILSECNYDFVFPCDDRAIFPLFRNAPTFSDYPVLPQSAELLSLTLDYRALREKLTRAGVAIPDEIQPNKIDAKNSACSGPDFQITTIPVSRYRDENFYVRLKDKEQPDTRCLSAPDKSPPTDPREGVVEGRPRGNRISVLAFFSRGGLVQAFQYRCLRRTRLNDTCTYQVSCAAGDSLIRQIEQVSKGIALEGPVSFLFYCDDQAASNPQLLSCNCSMEGFPLAKSCGIDFPWMAYEYFTGGHSQCRNREYPKPRYEKNAELDVHALAEAFSRIARSSRLQAALCILSEIFLSFMRTVSFRERCETFSFRDIRPFAAEIMSIWELIFGRLMKRLPFLTRNRSLTLRQRAADILRAGPDRRPKVLFLCYGNICRSPFAAYYFHERFGDGFDVYSSGMHPDIGRHSPDNAVLAGKRWNIVKMQEHRSSFISEISGEDIDLVVLFDDANIVQLKSSGYFSDVLTVKLGVFLDTRGPDIVDPYGKDVEAFERVYGEIASAIDAIHEVTR